MTDNITLPRATVQQALKTLEGIHRVDEYPELQPAVTALRTALEQQQAEPVVDEAIHAAWSAGYVEGEKAVLEQQTEPVQETEAFGFVTVRRLSQRFENHHDQYQFYPAGQIPYLDNVDECHTVYTTPPQRKPLSDEQIDDIWVEHGCEGEDAYGFARAIEAAHGIKEGT